MPQEYYTIIALVVTAIAITLIETKRKHQQNKQHNH